MVSIKFKTIDDFCKQDRDAALVTGIHSGNPGDVIYSLPSVRALGIRHILLNVYRDPNPFRRLTEEHARALAPLLLAQDYIDRVTLVSAGVPLDVVDPACIDVDYVLDRFRVEDARHHHLMHAHAAALHAAIDANAPFLAVPAGSPPANEVVVAFTPRYRALDEEFVRELTLYFDEILILSIPEEWRSVAGIPGRVCKCADYLEMAQIIAQSRIFIGNPGLASAIAEGLKAPRIVDLPVEPCNAFPIGPNGYVLPAGRREFVEIVHRVCGDLPRVASLYGDLLRSVEAQTSQSRDRLPLIGGTAAPRVRLEGGVLTRISREEHAVLLHPGPSETPPARAIFDTLQLSGHNCFQASLSVEHPQSAPIEFRIRICGESGTLLQESARQVQPAESVHWQVTFPRTFGPASLELSTVLAPGAESPDFAWAWIRNPQLRVI